MMIFSNFIQHNDIENNYRIRFKAWNKQMLNLIILLSDGHTY